MEAPEKIWINPSMDLPKLNGVIDRDSVQYILTDAFIEKTIKYIQLNWIWNTKMIEDFKNYIKEK